MNITQIFSSQKDQVTNIFITNMYTCITNIYKICIHHKYFPYTVTIHKTENIYLQNQSLTWTKSWTKSQMPNLTWNPNFKMPSLKVSTENIITNRSPSFENLNWKPQILNPSFDLQTMKSIWGRKRLREASTFELEKQVSLLNLSWISLKSPLNLPLSLSRP